MNNTKFPSKIISKHTRDNELQYSKSCGSPTVFVSQIWKKQILFTRWSDNFGGQLYVLCRSYIDCLGYNFDGYVYRTCTESTKSKIIIRVNNKLFSGPLTTLPPTLKLINFCFFLCFEENLQPDVFDLCACHRIVFVVLILLLNEHDLCLMVFDECSDLEFVILFC